MAQLAGWPPNARMVWLGFLRWRVDYRSGRLASEPFRTYEGNPHVRAWWASGECSPLPGHWTLRLHQDDRLASARGRSGGNWSGQPGCQKLSGKSGGGPGLPWAFRKSNQHELTPTLVAGAHPLRQEAPSSEDAAEIEGLDWFFVIVNSQERRLAIQGQPHTLSLAVPRHRPGNIAHHQFIRSCPARDLLNRGGYGG